MKTIRCVKNGQAITFELPPDKGLSYAKDKLRKMFKKKRLRGWKFKEESNA